MSTVTEGWIVKIVSATTFNLKDYYLTVNVDYTSNMDLAAVWPTTWQASNKLRDFIRSKDLTILSTELIKAKKTSEVVLCE